MRGHGNQRRAAAWNDGPVLILAGPGSGKTAVLTLRVARLLEEDESAAVLALTFTNKAAAEMRERVDHVLGEYTDRARLCTFHKFAADIVGQHGSHLGIRPDFRLFTRDEDRVVFLEEVLRKRFGGGLEMPSDRNNLLQLIDRLFSESYDGAGPSPFLASTPQWLPPLFNRYRKALVDANRLDYGSLLHFAIRLLTEHPAVARVVRLSWTHICVDEFQDTNRAQYDLLRLLAPDRHHNLFVVADDDPVAYQWNGAGPQRIRDLGGDYDVKTIHLPESHRCPAEILDHANRLIAHNPRLIDAKTTVSVREPQPAGERIVRYEVLPSPQSEAEFIGYDIRARGLSPADCGLLGRTNRVVLGAAAGLRSVGHQTFVRSNTRDFDSPVLGLLAEALRLANSRHDRVVLRRLCLEWERLTGVVIEPHAVGAAAVLVGGDFLRAWVDAADGVAGDARKVLQRIRTDLVDRLDFARIVDWFLEEGWQPWDIRDPEVLTWEEVRTWRDLHRDIVAKRGSGVTLNTYLRHFDPLSKKTPPGPDVVQCMTLRRARGVEFRHVYLIGMAQGVFPSYRALQRGPESKEVEEERRSCFVAVTRARETLTLTRARAYFGYEKGPSQFLGEMGVLRGAGTL